MACPYFQSYTEPHLGLWEELTHARPRIQALGITKLIYLPIYLSSMGFAITRLCAEVNPRWRKSVRVVLREYN